MTEGTATDPPVAFPEWTDLVPPLRLPVRGLAVLRVALEGTDAGGDPGLLSDIEKGSAAGFRQERDAQRYIVAHTALRRILADCVCIPPADVPIVTSPTGRPHLALDGGVEFSLSHSGPLALVAVGSGVVPGIDLEVVTPGACEHGVADRFFEPHEAEHLKGLEPSAADHSFLALWTRKEAILKAHGEGLSGLQGGLSTRGAVLEDAGGVLWERVERGSRSVWLTSFSPCKDAIAALAVDVLPSELRFLSLRAPGAAPGPWRWPFREGGVPGA